MPKTWVYCLILFTILFTPSCVFAGEKNAGNSATFVKRESQPIDFSYQLKKQTIKRILEENNSPLRNSVETFMKVCTEYNIDCYLLPSISALESSYGKFTKSGSNNPFGWGGGATIFDSWDDSITTVGEKLRTNYIDQGATTIEEIGMIYAASPTWATRVRWFMGKFKEQESQIQLYLPDSII